MRAVLVLPVLRVEERLGAQTRVSDGPGGSCVCGCGVFCKIGRCERRENLNKSWSDSKVRYISFVTFVEAEVSTSISR